MRNAAKGLAIIKAWTDPKHSSSHQSPTTNHSSYREWVESGGGGVALAKEYRVHRQLPSGRLSVCRLVLAPDGRMLLGVEVPGMSGGWVGDPVVLCFVCPWSVGWRLKIERRPAGH